MWPGARWRGSYHSRPQWYAPGMFAIARPKTALCYAAAVVAAGVLGAGCGGDPGETDNVLPATPTDSSSSTDDGMEVADDGATEVGSGTDTGNGGLFPATYRFGCVDIQVVGDGDGDAFQAIVLENAWRSDINNSKLNILLTVVERDDEAGTARIQVSSGVGADPSELCNEVNTISPVFDAAWEAGVASWQEGEGMVCSVDGVASDGVGTYVLELPPEQVVYIYAEDDDGTTFNCVPGGSAPNAVPIRAVQARVTAGPGEQVSYGNLTGCLTVAEATSLCSCIGMCIGDAHPNCGGCPTGSRPLATLLEGINPSPRCTDLLGEDSFDLQLGLTTELLGHVPGECG